MILYGSLLPLIAIIALLPAFGVPCIAASSLSPRNRDVAEVALEASAPSALRACGVPGMIPPVPRARVPFTDASDAAPTVATRREPRREAVGVRVSIVEGPDAGASTVVARRGGILGRAEGADLRLQDPTVSAFHMEIAAAEGGVRVQDLESTNGTHYAGARIGWCIVPSGASIRIGGTTARLDLDFSLEEDAPGEGGDAAAFGELRGRSAAMREAFALLTRLAPTDLSVLVEGPTGSGKELAARGLHALSRRASGPFVVLDCTAIPATIAESVLFGHEKGAFTGASERRAGMFESASGGTIFLDEVGELSSELQPKLLRVIERREVVRVGSAQARPVNVRVIGATWRDLRALVNRGRFREDLYYRLAQARVLLPALRDHPEDIALLVRHFLAKLPGDVTCAREIAQDALDELSRRDFAGNVRELKSTVERAAMMASSEVITSSDLAFERLLMGERSRATAPASAKADGSIERFKDAKRTIVEEFEREYLQRLLARTGDNLSRASATAGVERHHLRDLLRKYGLRSEE